MTTIAYRNGVLACDSEETHEDDKAGEISYYNCKKIYKKKVTHDWNTGKRLPKCHMVLIATRGEVGASLVGVDWYGSGDEVPDYMYADTQFDLLILTPHGLFSMDQYFRPTRVREEYFATGSGAKAALGAMYMGATAVEAIKAAIDCDPGTGGAVISESL